MMSFDNIRNKNWFTYSPLLPTEKKAEKEKNHLFKKEDTFVSDIKSFRIRWS